MCHHVTCISQYLQIFAFWIISAFLYRHENVRFATSYHRFEVIFPEIFFSHQSSFFVLVEICVNHLLYKWSFTVDNFLHTNFNMQNLAITSLYKNRQSVLSFHSIILTTNGVILVLFFEKVWDFLVVFQLKISKNTYVQQWLWNVWQRNQFEFIISKQTRSGWQYFNLLNYE